MNICYDCGKPIDKPHNHNTFVIIKGEKQALKDGETIGTFAIGAGRRTKKVKVYKVVSQKGE